MRKSLRLLALLCLCVLSLAACAKDKTAQGGSSVLLKDFEQWNPDFQFVRLFNGFGSVSINEDPAYVSTGSASAMVRPLGHQGTDADPLMVLGTRSLLYEFDYSDFSKTESVTFDIFNAETEAINMSVGLTFDGSAMIRNRPVTVTLQTGWNNVTYSVTPSLLGLEYDITNVEGIYLGFENAGTRELEEAPTLYLDNVVLHYYDVVPEASVQFDLDENEISNFDKLYQEYTIGYEISATEQTAPGISIVRASAYGIGATTGSNVLRVVTRPMYQPSGWSRFYFSEKLLDEVDFGKYDKDDVFKFDVYNTESSPVKFYLEFKTKDGLFGSLGFSALPKRWTEFSISLDEIDTFAGVKFTDKLGFIGIAWDEYSGNDREFFFDSFRIEKA